MLSKHNREGNRLVRNRLGSSVIVPAVHRK